MVNFQNVTRLLFSSVLVVGTLALSGCGFRSSPEDTYQVAQLEIWGVFDDTDAYSQAISDYKKINPFVKNITYRKLAPETYKEDLINAFAAGKGPDIFMVRNSWRAAFEDKTAPAPATLLSEREYRAALVDVAAADFIGSENKIYGIPLSVDSLALYYNKDLLNAVGISRAPETWDEVAEYAKRLTTVDQFGNIVRSGIALGTGTNINRSSDILSMLMLQLGSPIQGATPGKVNFSDQLSRQAFEYYTQFARIGMPVYSWNARQHYSIDAFSEGTTAMMINYSWQYEALKQKNAKLNLGIADLPQWNRDAPVNLANYWGYAVTKEKPPQGPTTDAVKTNSLRVFEAWQFLKYLALAGKEDTVSVVNALTGVSQQFPLTTDPTEQYLKKTNKPAARRDLITAQENDIVLGPFSYGNLIAKNWYQGNPEAVDTILTEMIESVVRGENTIQGALGVGGNRINTLSR